MCEMRGYSPKEFIRLLIDNGWVQDRQKGSHISFIKQGEAYIVTFPYKGSTKGKELSRPMIKRIIKEAHLKT